MSFFLKFRNKFYYYFYPEKLLTNKPIKNRDYYLKIFNEAKNFRNLEIEKILENNQININNNWFDNLALHTQVVVKDSKINYYHGKLLYSFLSKYIKVNNLDSLNILETGTARGYSSICMSKSLIDNNKLGKIHTIDILPNDKKMYWNCIDDHDQKKTRIELLNKWPNELNNINFITGKVNKKLSSLNLKRINFAFLDAAHTYEDVIYEYNFVSKLQVKGDLIFFDDVTPNFFDGVTKAIDYIKKKGDYQIDLISSSDERGYALAKKLN